MPDAINVPEPGENECGPPPKYLYIEGTERGDGWKILVWGDPQGELNKIQSRIDAKEIFTSVTVTTGTHVDSTREVIFDSPVASCQLLPLVPTVIKGTITPQGDGDRYTFTPWETSN